MIYDLDQMLVYTKQQNNAKYETQLWIIIIIYKIYIAPYTIYKKIALRIDFFMIFIHLHLHSSVLPHCHTAGVYHKHGCLCAMLQKQCLCIFDPNWMCHHPNHEIALHLNQ